MPLLLLLFATGTNEKDARIQHSQRCPLSPVHRLSAWRPVLSPSLPPFPQPSVPKRSYYECIWYMPWEKPNPARPLKNHLLCTRPPNPASPLHQPRASRFDTQELELFFLPPPHKVHLLAYGILPNLTTFAQYETDTSHRPHDTNTSQTSPRGKGLPVGRH